MDNMNYGVQIWIKVSRTRTNIFTFVDRHPVSVHFAYIVVDRISWYKYMCYYINIYLQNTWKCLSRCSWVNVGPSCLSRAYITCVMCVHLAYIIYKIVHMRRISKSYITPYVAGDAGGNSSIFSIHTLHTYFYIIASSSCILFVFRRMTKRALLDIGSLIYSQYIL